MVKIYNGTATGTAVLGRKKVLYAVNDNFGENIMVTNEEVDLIETLLGDRIRFILNDMEEAANDN